jgi:multidrug resistance efflux pump
MRALETIPIGPKRESRRIVLVGAVTLLLAFLLSLPRIHALLGSTSSAASSSNQTVVIEERTFSRIIRLSGTTQAAHSFVVLAPRLEGAQLSSMVITYLATPGAHVKKGDVLVRFDPQAQTKDYLTKQDQYTVLLGQLAQKRADEDIAKAKDDTVLEQAANESKRAQLEVQKNEIVSRIDAEKNHEALEEAQAALAQLKETYQLKRKAAAAAIHILELQCGRAQEAMRYAQSNATKMTIHSPMDGIAVFNTVWLGGRMGTVQTGDTVRPGVPFMQVVDPSQMEVGAPVNQADFAKVHRGQRALIHPDAYPYMSLPAVLDEISPLGQQGDFSDKVRTFSARFQIQGTDARLLPDLSVAVDIELEKQENALVVPLPSLSHEALRDYLWVKDGSGFDKRQVRVGERNDVEAVILSGVSRGDVVRASAEAVSPSKAGL